LQVYVKYIFGNSLRTIFRKKKKIDRDTDTDPETAVHRGRYRKDTQVSDLFQIQRESLFQLAALPPPYQVIRPGKNKVI
jgi:hypothetical protein